MAIEHYWFDKYGQLVFCVILPMRVIREACALFLRSFKLIEHQERVKVPQLRPGNACWSSGLNMDSICCHWTKNSKIKGNVHLKHLPMLRRTLAPLPSLCHLLSTTARTPLVPDMSGSISRSNAERRLDQEPGLHKLWYVLISWADQGSCAHKCVC